VYSNRFAFMRARYMLGSTNHWQPLVNGYSDHIPPDFLAREGMLGAFPTRESLAWLTDHQVKYALFHINDYSAGERESLEARLTEFAPELRPILTDGDSWLYEIGGREGPPSGVPPPRSP
jgi:hypothetical protein